MNKYSVLDGLNSADMVGLKNCLEMNEVFFRKGDSIMEFSTSGKDIGIVEEGLVYLISISNAGQENIIDYYEPGGLFGSPLSPHTSVNLFNAVAKKDSRILLTNQENIVRTCKKTCEKHIKFINNMIVVLSSRNQMHLDILSQRTIRDKLRVYLHYLSEKAASNEMTLPISLSDLADYLSVDRSAMMREIRKMNGDGLIRSKGQSVILMEQ